MTQKNSQNRLKMGLLIGNGFLVSEGSLGVSGEFEVGVGGLGLELGYGL
jgi:hypothetical protein